MIENPMNSYGFSTWLSKTIWMHMVFEVATFFLPTVAPKKGPPTQTSPGSIGAPCTAVPTAPMPHSRASKASAGATRKSSADFVPPFIRWDFMEAFSKIGKTHFLYLSRCFPLFVFYFFLLSYLFEQKIKSLIFIFWNFVNCSSLDFWALYGLLVVTIVLVAKDCVERSFSGLWKIRISSFYENSIF